MRYCRHAYEGSGIGTDRRDGNGSPSGPTQDAGLTGAAARARMSKPATLSLPGAPRTDTLQCDAGVHVTCRKCKVPMKEFKGHIYHKQRKWKCPKCAKVRMQKQK
jgi:hypothetical protein